jgi:hypothetical protein
MSKKVIERLNTEQFKEMVVSGIDNCLKLNQGKINLDSLSAEEKRKLIAHIKVSQELLSELISESINSLKGSLDFADFNGIEDFYGIGVELKAVQITEFSIKRGQTKAVKSKYKFDESVITHSTKDMYTLNPERVEELYNQGDANIRLAISNKDINMYPKYDKNVKLI